MQQYFQQQVAVQLRIEELNKLIEEDNRKRKDIAGRLEDISANEHINQYGIMNNSVLTVNIIEARGLIPSNTGYKAFLSTEGQRIYTEVSLPKQGDPVWKEVVTFDIQTGKEPLYI